MKKTTRPNWKTLSEFMKEECEKDPTFEQGVEEKLNRLRLAAQVRDLRKKLDFTQQELAERAGTNQASIAKVENGAAIPKLDLLSRVVHALGAELRVNIVKPRKAHKEVVLQEA